VGDPWEEWELRCFSFFVFRFCFLLCMGWISELRHFFFLVRGGFGWGVSVPLSSLVVVEDGYMGV